MTMHSQPGATSGGDGLRDVAAGDFAAILALNDAETRQTSPMDQDRLRSLVSLCEICRVFVVDGRLAAFLIALRDGAAYDNDNFRWFSARFERFLYVDRIVVDATYSGRRIGSRLYDDLFAAARTRGIETIACEYNLDPPNPASRAFHDRFGFREVGQQRVADGTKRVSMQVASVPESSTRIDRSPSQDR